MQCWAMTKTTLFEITTFRFFSSIHVGHKRFYLLRIYTVNTISVIPIAFHLNYDVLLRALHARNSSEWCFSMHSLLCVFFLTFIFLFRVLILSIFFFLNFNRFTRKFAWNLFWHWTRITLNHRNGIKAFTCELNEENSL